MDNKLHLDSAVAEASRKWKLDAGESAFLTRQLTYILPEVYKVEYPDLMARRLFPIRTDVPSGALSFNYEMWDETGEAIVVDNYATDFPTSNVNVEEFAQKIVSIGASYQYSMQEIRAAAMANTPLEAMKATATRRSVERKLEAIACTGNSATNMTGFTNNASILSESVTDGTWTAGEPDDVITDVNALAKKINLTTKGIYWPDTLVVGTKGWGLLQTTPVAYQYQNTMLYNWLLQACPWLKAIEFWPYLDTAGSGGAERIMAYKKDPECLQLVIPQDFEQMPPEVENMAFKVACHMRTGGLQIRRPKTVCYMDGTQS